MAIVDSRYGQYVEYNGREAKFISQIDWNDLFGMNRNINIKSYNEKRIAEEEAKLDKLDARIQENKKRWNFYDDVVINIRHSIRSLFNRLNINSASKIVDKKDRKIYDSYVEEKTGARFAQLRASSDIQSDVNTSLDIIFHKHGLELQNLLA